MVSVDFRLHASVDAACNELTDKLINCEIFLPDVRNSQKKKKKDRERDKVRDKDRDKERTKERDKDRDKHRDKDKGHKHKGSSSSSSKSSKSSALANSSSIVTSNGDAIKSKPEQNANRSNSRDEERPSKTDAGKCLLSPSASKSLGCAAKQPSQPDEPAKSSGPVVRPSSSDCALALGEPSCAQAAEKASENGKRNVEATEVAALTSNAASKSNETPNNRPGSSHPPLGRALSSDAASSRSASLDDSNHVPDTTTTDVEAADSRQSPPNVVAPTTATATAAPQPPAMSKSERKVFVPSTIGERKPPTEAAGIMIKKEYLPSPAKRIKVEKTRDDVTRVLNFDAGPQPKEPEASAKPRTTDAVAVKTEPDESTASISTLSSEKSARKPHESDDDKSDTPKRVKSEGSTSGVAKDEHKPRDKAGDAKGGTKSSSGSVHRHSSSKASTSKSSHSSGKDCARCYRRSKIKHSSAGTQCTRYGEPFKTMQATAVPLTGCKTLASDSASGVYSDLKYGRFFHIEVHSNGGASIVHMYQDEIAGLTDDEMDELTEEFFRVTFSENEDGFAHHVMGIVHDAAGYIPDLLEHFSENYSTLTVKAGVLGRNSDIETLSMVQYYEQVAKNYMQGTFRYGPLHQISLVGKVHEEVGGYFPDLLGRLEMNPFLKKVRSICSANRKIKIKN